MMTNLLFGAVVVHVVIYLLTDDHNSLIAAALVGLGTLIIAIREGAETIVRATERAKR